MGKRTIGSGHPRPILRTKEIYFPQRKNVKGLRDKDRRYRIREKGKGAREREIECLSQSGTNTGSA